MAWVKQIEQSMLRHGGRPCAHMEIPCAVLTYCCCSGGMLIVNKLALHHIPLPAVLTVCQFSSASLVVYTCKLLGILEMDNFEWARGRYFLVYVAFFTIGTYTNMKVLSLANVETVVVFRSCTPLAVSICDYVFYERELPNRRSCAALLLITLGAAGYMVTDREFQLHGLRAYFWVSIWWVVLVVQLTFGKFLVGNLNNKTLWTPVLYTNTFSVIPTLIIGWLAGEISERRLLAISFDTPTLCWVFLSCAIGILISWAGFWCQSLVTATAYSVVGVMNKILTVAVDIMIWHNHGSVFGMGSLCLCIVGGSLYQQAPFRADSRAIEVNPEETALQSSTDELAKADDDPQLLIQKS